MALDAVGGGGAQVELTAALWRQVSAPVGAPEGASLPGAVPPAQASLGRLLDLMA